jgi:dolichyl-phosphate-mannose--protein O-mannosyl transferase
MFGDNSWAWRLPVAISGITATFLTWCLAKILFPKSKTLPLLAALLVTMESLIYTQSRIMMNDMVVLMWQLAALIFYLKWQKKNQWSLLFLMALFTGLACATKWSGVYLFLIFGLHQFYLWCGVKKQRLQHLLKSAGNLLVILVGAALIYLAVYIPLFTTGHDWSHFAELHRQIWMYQTNLEATHEYSAPAYLWPLGLKPVYLYYDAATKKQIFNTPTYAIFYLGLLGLLLSVVLLIKKRRRDFPDGKSLGFLLLTFLCVWCPWLFSPRIMFLHHFLPAVPLLCIWASYLLVWMIKHCWSKTK